MSLGIDFYGLDTGMQVSRIAKQKLAVYRGFLSSFNRNWEMVGNIDDLKPEYLLIFKHLILII